MISRWRTCIWPPGSVWRPNTVRSNAWETETTEKIRQRGYFYELCGAAQEIFEKDGDNCRRHKKSLIMGVTFLDRTDPLFHMACGTHKVLYGALLRITVNIVNEGK